MPAKSKAQFRLMAAASEGRVPGIKRSVGREFIEASRGKTKRLPEKVKRKPRR
jgi:hypothetical protein